MEKLEEIIATLSRYFGQMEESAKEQYNFKELSITQMHYLEMISELENPNLTELAVAMKLTKPTVKVLIDKLVNKNYLVRVRSDEDRRSAHLHLTDKGKLINRMHAFAHQRIVEDINTKISQEEMVLLTDILRKITHN